MLEVITKVRSCYIHQHIYLIKFLLITCICIYVGFLFFNVHSDFFLKKSEKNKIFKIVIYVFTYTVTDEITILIDK